jgi:hypothetical protein
MILILHIYGKQVGGYKPIGGVVKSFDQVPGDYCEKTNKFYTAKYYGQDGERGYLRYECIDGDLIYWKIPGDKYRFAIVIKDGIEKIEDLSTAAYKFEINSGNQFFVATA